MKKVRFANFPGRSPELVPKPLLFVPSDTEFLLRINSSKIIMFDKF